MKDTPPARVRFGSFELDLKSGELRDGDRRTLLQIQPFKVLLILIERNGEIATREEIKKKLWPNDTIVEFDHSINVAVGTLRRALGDSAEQPQYIETLARRGYRLLVPVERVEPGAANLAISDGTAAQMQHEAVGLIGKKVSHYRVLEIIGGGGMGLVYKAEDIKLGRRVALKFLPEELASDPVALQRFEREAQTASSLNHPNICTIHEVEEYEGQPFIVMELLEGETLRDRLAACEAALPLEDLLDIALQVSDGLKAAHERGIIHRDIKPANIFLTASGQVKILDFGLAKLVVEAPGFSGAKEGAMAEIPSDLSSRAEPPAFGSGVEESAVVGVLENADPSTPCPPGHENAAGKTGGHSAQDDSAKVAEAHLTHTGLAMGTAGYMSPEQVRGEKLDARTDLFSFGLVLYEMATGQRAFSGETAAVVHNAILNNSPVALRGLNSTLPAKLVTTIDKALEKDRELRYQSAAEMRADLEEALSGKRPTLHRPWKWFATAALLVAVAVGGWLYYRSRNTLTLTANDTIVLADFTNSTTDPVFDDALNTALRVELEQTPFLNLLASEKVRGTLTLLKHPEDTKLTTELAREVCLSTNSRAFVTSSIADSGNRFRVLLRALDCQDSKAMVATEAQAEDRNQVVKALGAAGIQLRSKLGEPKELLQKFNKPLQEATSSSLEALQSLSEGRRLRGQQGDAVALPHFRRAVELDPNYADAYLSLAGAYRNLTEGRLLVQNGTRAFELRDRVSQPQRLFIEAYYYSNIAGDLEKAFQTYNQWMQTYPRDPTPHANASGKFQVTGQYESAAIEAREALRMQPSANNYYLLAYAYLSLGRLDEAKAVFEQAKLQRQDTHILRVARYLLAFLQRDNSAMQEELTSATGKRGGEDQMISTHSDTEAYFGRLKKAREFSQRAVASAKLAGAQDAAAYWAAMQALREAEVGNADQGRRTAAEALALGTGGNRPAALAMARAGDSVRALELSDRINRNSPADTIVQKYELPTIQAAMQLNARNPGEAVNTLKVATQYELGGADIEFFYPAYVRGEAYLQAGEGSLAAAEFQKIIDHPGIVLNFVTGALAHLQLGRAQVMMGDKAAARKSYQNFLTLWKDADPDIPIYQQAKAEYARLR